MDSDLPLARLERLEEMSIELDYRLLWLEDRAGVPMSIIERLIAQRAVEQRRRPSQDRDLRLEAFRGALAEAERTGTNAPIDRFVQKLKAGGFGQHLW
jgi:hypothetical protein